jgi:hypothetical protein
MKIFITADVWKGVQTNYKQWSGSTITSGDNRGRYEGLGDINC